VCLTPVLRPSFRRIAKSRPIRHPENGLTTENRLKKRRRPVPEEQSTAAAESAANQQLFVQLYAELRKLAERQLRRNAGAPISPTTLLHEAYLDMSAAHAAFPDRERFMGYAARVMRGLIIDFVRERRAVKRGAGVHITELPTEVEQIDAAELSRLSDALDALAVRDPRLAQVVDLKYFCGFTFDEIGAQRGTSARTVQRDWEKARIILFQDLHST
jgi:RNA polymerase sigma factor (TIGR02999 family)